MGPHAGKVGLVSVPGPESYIQGARGLFGGIDVHLMDGEGEDMVRPGKDDRRPVSLVEIAVDDHGLPDLAFRPELFHRHGHVVQDAEPLPVIGKGVMEPASDMDRQAILQSFRGREGRPAHGEEGEPDEGLRVGELQRLDFCRGKRSRLQLPEILGSVNAEDIIFRRGFRLQEILFFRSHGQEPLVNQPVLADGEDVMPGIEQPILIAIDKLEREPPPDEGLEDVEDLGHPY